jgi:histone H3/H4
VKQLAKSVADKIGVAAVAKKMARAISKNGDGDLSQKKVRETAKEIAKAVIEQTARHAAEEAVKVVAEGT